MIVFDLDDCLWTPEMHELPGCPEIPVHGELNPNNTGGKQQKGVVGLQVPRYRDTVTLYDGARKVLYELATNPIYKDVLLATASSSLEPSYSYACLAGIEILPGLTMGDMMSFNQIGRSGNLSPDKTTHFRELHDESGVPYNEMLFFDDWCVQLLAMNNMLRKKWFASFFKNLTCVDLVFLLPRTNQFTFLQQLGGSLPKSFKCIWCCEPADTQRIAVGRVSEGTSEIRARIPTKVDHA